MPGEDSLSSRFDYLFEPLDVEESPDAVAAVSSSSADLRSPPDAAPVRMAFAAFVLATLGVVAAIAALLVQRPSDVTDPTDPVEGPLEPPLSTVAGVPAPAPSAPPGPAAVVPAESTPTIDSTPRRVTTPATPPQTSSPRRPEGGVTNSPTTRAPISVAPETRTPFPNQAPGAGRNGGGGLLGGLL